MQQFTIVLMALVASIGVAAIPSASLVAISLLVEAIGLIPASAAHRSMYSAIPAGP